MNSKSKLGRGRSYFPCSLSRSFFCGRKIGYGVFFLLVVADDSLQGTYPFARHFWQPMASSFGEAPPYRLTVNS